MAQDRRRRANYGEQATGKFLEDEFSKPPFGWDFEAVRLLALSLLRAGAVEAVSKGETIDSATIDPGEGVLSQTTTCSASTSFRPKKGIDMTVRVEAADNFKETFGDEVKELTTGAIAAAIREAVERHEDDLQKSLGLLRTGRLPGGEVLENASDQIRAIRRGSRGERDHHVQRLAPIDPGRDQAGDGPFLGPHRDRAAGHRTRQVDAGQGGAPSSWRSPTSILPSRRRSTSSRTALAKETFFRDVAEIEQAATAVGSEYKRRYDLALDARVAAYVDAVAKLEQTPGWERLDDEQRDEVARPLRQCADRALEQPDHLASAVRDGACEGRLATAVEKIHKILEGERLATVSIGKFFSGGIENDEQLEQALSRHPRRILPAARRRQDRDREVACRWRRRPATRSNGRPSGPGGSWKRTSREQLQGDYDVMRGRPGRGAAGRAPDRAPTGSARPDRRSDRAQARAGHEAERGGRRLSARRRVHDAEPFRRPEDAGGPRPGSGMRQQGRGVIGLRQRVLRLGARR